MSLKCSLLQQMIGECSGMTKIPVMLMIHPANYEMMEYAYLIFLIPLIKHIFHYTIFLEKPRQFKLLSFAGMFITPQCQFV